MRIWFIGTGFIGWNMAANFKERGFDVAQYSLEKEFIENKEKMQEAEIVFVAVPTPTKNRKFDNSVLLDAIKNTVAGQKIVIKSTIKAGTTDMLQEMYPDRYFFHSAEFLTERNARADVDNPSRNVIGYTEKSKQYASEILEILPKSEINIICTAIESEMGKYFANFLLTTKLIMGNLMYDACQKMGIDYEMVKNIAQTDKRIGTGHLEVVFEWGRWANGHCFPKDLATFHEMYGTEWLGHILLEAIENYNIQLNLDSNKQMDIINSVYGLTN